jgi:hypothetical protein
MSHQGRHDHPNSIHLVSVRARGGTDIFGLAAHPPAARATQASHPPQLQCWESLLARACDRHAARVHGYTWLPDEALFLLQRSAVAMSVVLASLLGQYSRYLHRTGVVAPGRSPYTSRYESIEVTQSALPYAVRHLYWRAVRAGLCIWPDDYPWCSYAQHCADVVPTWFEQAEFIACLKASGVSGPKEVHEFLSQAEDSSHEAIFRQRSGRTPRITGLPADIERARWQASHPPSPPPLHHIFVGVRRLLRRGLATFDRDVLGKALITWYATRSGVATLEELALRFGCSPSTLRRDIESHRRRSPELFERGIGLAAMTDDAERPHTPWTGTSLTAPEVGTRPERRKPRTRS